MSRRRERWEGLCRQCGLCCYERKLVAGGVRIDLSKPCIYLDSKTRQCKVYTRRLRVVEHCRKVTLLHALFGRLMPMSCGYVQRYRRHFREHGAEYGE